MPRRHKLPKGESKTTGKCGGQKRHERPDDPRRPDYKGGPSSSTVEGGRGKRVAGAREETRKNQNSNGDQ